jgi:Chaperone of endosialidase
MPTHLDNAITKLSDKGVQSRVRSTMRKATLDALKKEGIELSPAEWGELTARMIAANPDAKKPNDFFGDIADIVRTVVPVLGSILSDRRLKTNIVHCETLQNGLRIVEFSYLGFTNRWRGLIAQDVLQSHPDAIVEDENGHLTVDYKGLNVSLLAA